jgi:P27 family predicted phage terminase small subunit
MGRKAVPIDILLQRKKKNLTKAEIEARRAAEAKIKPSSNQVKPPSWLDAAAKKEFKKLANELLQTELITNVDVNQLAMYCSTLSRYIELQKGQEVEDPETGDITIEFDEKKIDILFKQIKGMAAEFGFTPGSRAKIAIKPEKEKEKTAEEEMFGNV